MISKIFAKLKDPEYRKAFVDSQISIAIPFQIRGLLKSRGWRQEDLAAKAGMRQPRISALLSPGEARPNIETLRRLAGAFDCGLQVRFVPFSELVNRSETFDPDNFNIPTFDEEVQQWESLENANAAKLLMTVDWDYHVDVSNLNYVVSDPRYQERRMSITDEVATRSAWTSDMERYLDKKEESYGA